MRDSIPPFHDLNIPTSFLNWELEALITHIVNVHHSYARARGSNILMLLNEMLANPAVNQQVIPLREAFSQFFRNLDTNMLKEETILFPNILQLIKRNKREHRGSYSTFGLISDSINYMENAHISIHEGLLLFRKITKNYNTETGNIQCHQLYNSLLEFETNLLHHIRLENLILFPKAIEIEENPTTIKSYSRKILN